MPTAKLMWPIEDLNLDFERAKIEATVDIPRILAENGWTAAGDPTDWREVEGEDAQLQPQLYLVCHLEVTVTDAAEAAA